MPRSRRSLHPSDAFEVEILKHATRFRTIRFLGRGQYDRREFDSFAEAVADAGDDQRAMLYAVNARGRFALIARRDWPEVLARN